MDQDVFLVKAAKKGNQEAFVQLFQKYEAVLYNMGRKFLVNEEDLADCMQETALDAYKNLKQLKQPEYFNTWLCRILINNCKKQLTKQKNLDYQSLLMNQGSATTQALEIRSMLLELDSKYSMPLVLYYYNGFSIKEISEILSLPVNTVKNHLARGKQLLKITSTKEE